MSVDLAVADAYPGPMIETEDHAGLRILRIARPDKAGALTPDMLGALAQGVRTAPGTAIILTGTGKVFSAGADLDAARAGLATSPLWEELSGEIARFPGLTIAALAAELDTPEHRVRALINRRLGYRNFSAFLNRHRIAEAREKLVEKESVDLPVLTIAMDLGYNSLATFNRAFRAETGTTPSDYRRLGLAVPADQN